MADTDRIRHDFKGHLSIIIGFADLMLREMPPDDPRRADVEEIRTAAIQALDLLAAVFPADSGPVA
jgi:hypothetical protein